MFFLGVVRPFEANDWFGLYAAKLTKIFGTEERSCALMGEYCSKSSNFGS